MQPPEYYKNREQTYLKHFFLERYLEKVAFIIGRYGDFVFVDGFSGPWRATGEAFEDTSFMIAVQKLRYVIEGLKKIGRTPTLRCVFVEKTHAAYNDLEQAVKNIADLKIATFHGEFEQQIPAIQRYIGTSFALFFIDPTGWTGYGMDAIRPVLQHRGEVLINFMFDHINRFINEHPNEEVQASFDELFGTNGWRDVIPNGPGREKAIVDFYCHCLKTTGNYAYVTYTRIDHPTKERTYFYLIYGTRHIKGVQEFRKVEKVFAPEQIRVRLLAKAEKRLDETGQRSLFSPNLDDLSPLETERVEQLAAAKERFEALIGTFLIGQEVPCEKVFGALLEIPLCWESDVQTLLKEYHDKLVIEIVGMKPRERTVKVEQTLRRLK